MENEYTGRTIYVVGRWRGNVWLGQYVYTDYGMARRVAVRAGVEYSLERMREIAGDEVSPQRYWFDRGIR